MKKKRNQRGLGRSAFTIIELGLVVVVGLVLVIGAIGGYKKLYIPMKGNTAYQQVNSVIGAIERSKMANDNVFPAYGTATKISAITLLQNELGGSNNSKDVADWTYKCTSGSAKAITLLTTSFDDDVIASIAAQKVNSTLAPWTATVTGTVVTATLSNVTCN